jgi:hypothetical protein
MDKAVLGATDMGEWAKPEAVDARARAITVLNIIVFICCVGVDELGFMTIRTVGG